MRDIIQKQKKLLKLNTQWKKQPDIYSHGYWPKSTDKYTLSYTVITFYTLVTDQDGSYHISS